MHQERYGEGAPLLFIHGLGGTAQTWHLFKHRLAGFEKIFIDLPGFGQSPPGDRVHPRQLAEQITAVFEAEGFDRLDVVGNSLGGWIALELGHMGYARSVTALAPAGLWSHRLAPRPDTRGIPRLLLPALPQLLRNPRVRRRVLGGLLAHPERVDAVHAMDMVNAYLTAPGFKAVNSAMRANVFTDLANIPCPVSLVWGKQDRLVKPPRVIPTSVHSIILSDVGHLPQWDAPDTVEQYILRNVQAV